MQTQTHHDAASLGFFHTIFDVTALLYFSFTFSVLISAIFSKIFVLSEVEYVVSQPLMFSMF